MGSGELRYEDFFATAAARFPEKFAVRMGFDEALAHRIEAGADIFLMPSLYEPCGLNQMFSLKYGTIPIVRAIGGLKDTVIDYDAEPGKGTGFVFDRYRVQCAMGEHRKSITGFYREPIVDRADPSSDAHGFFMGSLSSSIQQPIRTAFALRR